MTTARSVNPVARDKYFGYRLEELASWEVVHLPSVLPIFMSRQHPIIAVRKYAIAKENINARARGIFGICALQRRERSVTTYKAHRNHLVVGSKPFFQSFNGQRLFPCKSRCEPVSGTYEMCRHS